MCASVDGGTSGAGSAVDVVVLTALEVEYRAVRAPLEEVREAPEERGSRFETGVLRNGTDRDGRTVAIHMTGPGNPAAAALAERALALFAPLAVLFVGVAGGRKDVRLGDVVAADVVYDYETGKDTEQGFLPRHKTHHCAHRLVQQARAVAAAAADRWQDRVRPATPEPRPLAHVKPIAAGGRVIGHPESQVGRHLAASAGDVVAVDMEGYGFLTGTHLNQQVDALLVRGISDLLGDKTEAHDERWQPVAARHAAAFAYELIAGLPARAAPTRARRRNRPTVHELGSLASLLLAVPGLSAPVRWQQLLDELPSVGTAVSRQSASRAEALSLLRTCDAHNAWAELLDVVTVISPDSPAVAELKQRMAELGLR